METEQELNELLAKWRWPNGKRLAPFPSVGDILWGTKEEQHWVNFPHSLDDIFKWLVPKYISEVCKLPMGLTSIMSIYAFLFAEWLKVMQEKIEPALALCKVVEKLIGGKDV